MEPKRRRVTLLFGRQQRAAGSHTDAAVAAAAAVAAVSAAWTQELEHWLPRLAGESFVCGPDGRAELLRLLRSAGRNAPAAAADFASQHRLRLTSADGTDWDAAAEQRVRAGFELLEAVGVPQCDSQRAATLKVCAEIAAACHGANGVAAARLVLPWAVPFAAHPVLRLAAAAAGDALARADSLPASACDQLSLRVGADGVVRLPQALRRKIWMRRPDLLRSAAAAALLGPFPAELSHEALLRRAERLADAAAWLPDAASEAAAPLTRVISAACKVAGEVSLTPVAEGIADALAVPADPFKASAPAAVATAALLAAGAPPADDASAVLLPLHRMAVELHVVGEALRCSADALADLEPLGFAAAAASELPAARSVALCMAQQPLASSVVADAVVRYCCRSAGAPVRERYTNLCRIVGQALEVLSFGADPGEEGLSQRAARVAELLADCFTPPADDDEGPLPPRAGCRPSRRLLLRLSLRLMQLRQTTCGSRVLVPALAAFPHESLHAPADHDTLSCAALVCAEALLRCPPRQPPSAAAMFAAAVAESLTATMQALVRSDAAYCIADVCNAAVISADGADMWRCLPCPEPIKELCRAAAAAGAWAGSLPRA